MFFYNPKTTVTAPDRICRRDFYTFLAASYASCLPYLYLLSGQSLTRTFTAMAGTAALTYTITHSNMLRDFLQKATLAQIAPENTHSAAPADIQRDFEILKENTGVPQAKLIVSSAIGENAYADLKGHVILGPKMLAELSCPQTAFITAHELDHIKNDDTVKHFQFSGPKYLSYVAALSALVLMAGAESMLGKAPADQIAELTQTMHHSIASLPLIALSCVAIRFCSFAAQRSMELRSDQNAVLRTGNRNAAIEVIHGYIRPYGQDHKDLYECLTSAHPSANQRMEAVLAVEMA